MTFSMEKIAPALPLVDMLNTVLRDFSDRVASLSATESEPANPNLAKGDPAMHTFLEEGCISLSSVFDGRHQAVCEALYDQVNDAINQVHVGDAPIADLETMDRVLRLSAALWDQVAFSVGHSRHFLDFYYFGYSRWDEVKDRLMAIETTALASANSLLTIQERLHILQALVKEPLSVTHIPELDALNRP